MSDNRLSDAELTIMQCFWEQGPMGTEQLAPLVAGRNWKPTTLLTFLSRLSGKGMLAAEKRGKTNLYTPLVSREEYLHSEGHAFLEDVYGGSARDFLVAMVDSRKISEDEILQLKEWLDQQEFLENE